MTKKETCKHCKYWDDEGILYYPGHLRPLKIIHHCRINPPPFPCTEENEWCGKFETLDVNIKKQQSVITNDKGLPTFLPTMPMPNVIQPKKENKLICPICNKKMDKFSSIEKITYVCGSFEQPVHEKLLDCCVDCAKTIVNKNLE